MDNELWRWIWSATVIVLTLGEMITAGFFVLPFAIGALLAAVVAWADGPGFLQWLLFFGGSAVSMVVVRIFIRNQDEPKEDDLPVGVNRYIGMEAVVLEPVDSVANTGRVRVQTEVWRATVDGAAIEEGALVTVVGLQGTRLLVKMSDTPDGPAATDSSDDTPSNQNQSGSS